MSDDHLTRLIEQAQDLIYECDTKGHFTYVNPVSIRLMKYTADELIGRHYLTLVRPDYRARAIEVYSQQFAARTPSTYFEFPAIAGDGATVWVGQHVQLLFDQDQIAGFQAIARDITKQRAAEEALKRSEARYRSLFEGAIFGIYRSHIDGRLLDVNPSLVAMLGYESASELMTLRTPDLYLNPSARGPLMEELARSGRIQGVDVKWVRKDGTAVAVRLSARAITDDRGPDAEYETLVEDVTERRHLESHLRQVQKIEAVGQLAAGIAHNFNNLLTAVLGYTELLLSRATTQADREDLGEIQKAGQRAAVLTRQLLAFSRRQAPVAEHVDINEAIRQLRGMLDRVIREDIQLTCEFAPGPALVNIDPSEFEQVVLNLVLNARDAMPGGGRIVIGITQVDAATEKLSSLPPGSYVRLNVTDTGMGITPEVRAHLFEPFFTTKEQGKGTGLGLASAYGIVSQSQGLIGVNTEVGRGTTFSVYLPAVGQAAAAATAAAADWPPLPATTAPSRNETILVVEDEDGVRTIAKAILVRHGYNVFDAATPDAACKIFAEHGDDIDLLLTDVVMPDMNGPALAQRLVGLRPGLRVLFMSGYSDRASLPGLSNPNARLLAKPFRPSALAATVREILAAR
jgi:two-component system cell cycle sensor histidine kinase/response regulator CckA